MSKSALRTQYFSGLSKKIKKEEGFSLVEMLVAIGILVVFTSLTLAAYPRIRESFALRRAAQEVAIGIRQAQVYSLGSREFGSGVFPDYGVFFDRINSRTSFIVFADTFENNNIYTDGSDGKVSDFNIQASNIISNLCGSDDETGGICTEKDEINIVYRRPYLETILTGWGSGYTDYTGRVEIEISSPSGITRTIVVYKGGEIEIK